MSLLELNNTVTDKNTTHAYLETYEKLFQHKKNSQINLLEIGVYHGGSLKLWDDYFTNAQIYGVDISSHGQITIDSIKNKQNITLLLEKDAYNETFISNYISNTKFDILIDDGPHTLESMIFFVENYSNLMKDDGTLIVEDIQDFAWIEILKHKTPEHLRQYIHVVDLRNVKGRYDDILFIIDKSGKL